MATHDTAHASDDSDYARGTMDISDHVKTWLSFWNGAKWSVVSVVFIVILLAIFRTHNG